MTGYYDEPTTWVAQDGATINKTISVTSSAADATITPPVANAGAMIEIWGNVDFYLTVTQSATAVDATANSRRCAAGEHYLFPARGSSVTVSALRVAVDGSVYVSLVKRG